MYSNIKLNLTANIKKYFGYNKKEKKERKVVKKKLIKIFFNEKISLILQS